MEQNGIPDCNIEDPLVVWKARISYSLGIPAEILDKAQIDSDNRLLPFIEQVQTWVSKRPFDADDGFQLPPLNWEETLMIFFPMTPDQIKSFSIEIGYDKDYVKWRHIVMCHLRKLGDSYGSGSDTSLSVELEISDVSYDILSSKFPIVINIEKSTCTQKTRFIKSLKETLDSNRAVQIYGGPASGKTTAVCSILTQLTYAHFSAEIRLLVTCKRNEPVVLKEFKRFMNYLKNKNILTTEETNRLSSEKHFCSALLACLGSRPFSVVIGFDTVKYDRQDKGKEDIQLIASLLDTALSLQNKSLKLIVATLSKDYFLPFTDLSLSTKSKQVKIQVFDLNEAVHYLGAPTTDHKAKGFLADDEPSADVNQLKGAEDLAVYYCCNPLCLKVAKQHCATHRVSYTSYLKSMRASSREYALNVSEALQDNITRQAFLAMHNQDDTRVQGKRTSDVMRVLSYVDSANIPIVYIGRVCQILREVEEPGSLSKLSEDTSLLNLHEASRVVYRLAEDDVLTASSISYPNGEISIATHHHDVNRTQGGNDHSLQVALRAMLGMLSKDNSKTVADIRLNALRHHVESLIKHAVRKLREKSIDEQGMQLMTLCRLREIYSQALMQGRVAGGVDLALNALEDAFLMVWEVVCHYNKPCGIFCFSLDSGAVHKQLLFDEAKDPERESHEIAKRCKIAGEAVDFIEDYSVRSLVLRPKNMREFIERIKATSPGVEEREAEKKLLPVKLVIEHHVAVDKNVVEALRNFDLFLSESALKSSFFAERLTSLFHTYGRQVLYNKHIMTRLQQIKCEYYTDLAHHVAKASRHLTSVRLMNEYISQADAAMPRMLHRKQTDERLQTRLFRYQRAYDWLKSNRNPDGVFFENGLYRQVVGTPHTMLNADRLMVKAQCKMLSGKVTLKDRKDTLPDVALEDCQRVVDVAYANYSDLGFAPRCCVQVAKLYGAVGQFKKAFETYDTVFESKVNAIGRERGSFAWAVDNLCRTTVEYLKCGNAQADLEQRRSEAIGKCKEVMSLDQEKTWTEDRMCNWVDVLEGFM